MPIAAAGRDVTLVGRLREDWSRPGALAMFVVGDQIRFGWSVVNDSTGEPAVAGVDFATVGQDGRLRSITGFDGLAPVLPAGS